MEWHGAELADALEERDFLRETQVVFHLACTTTPPLSEADPAADIVDNLSSAVRVMAAAARQGVGRFVFLSSGGTVYGVPSQVPIAETAATEPISAHGLQKLSIERYLELFRRTRGLESVVLRIANPYGPLQRPRRSQGVVAAFLEAGLQGGRWRSGATARWSGISFSSTTWSRLFSSPRPRSSARACSTSPPAKAAPSTPLRRRSRTCSAEPLRRVYHAARPADVPVNVLDVSRIRQELGWVPQTAWAEGLRRTAAWWKAQSCASATP